MAILKILRSFYLQDKSSVLPKKVCDKYFICAVQYSNTSLFRPLTVSTVFTLLNLVWK